MNEDWELLLSFFPPGWEALALESGALKGLRKDRSPENLLRVLPLHPGCGHSLRETAVRARRAGLADLSPVALKKRLAKAGPWLLSLCQALFEERGPAPDRADAGLEIRAVDATTVKEPGKTGSLWRVHCSVRLPSLVCDHFLVTETEGAGTGEPFRQFPVADGDCLIGDRGCSTASGIAHVAAAGGHVMVRASTGSLHFLLPGGHRFDLLAAVSGLDRPGSVASWDVATDGNGPVASVDGRVRVVRKSDAAIQDRAGKAAPEGGQGWQEPEAAVTGVRQACDRLHDVPCVRVHPGGGSRLVPAQVAGGTGVQAFQVGRAAGASSEARRRKLEGLALRQAVHRPAG